MQHKRFSLVLLGFGLVLAGRTAAAHHSELAEFDPDDPVTVTGTLRVPTKSVSGVRRCIRIRHDEQAGATCVVRYRNRGIVLVIVNDR